jgi:hypothetical protein
MPGTRFDGHIDHSLAAARPGVGHVAIQATFGTGAEFQQAVRVAIVGSQALRG